MAWRQMGNLIRMLQGYAADFDMKVVLLPLRRSIADLMNHLSEATLISAMLRLDRVGVMASSYNMALEAESLPALRRCGSLLWHMRTSNVLGNRLCAPGDGENYGALFEILREMGYEGRISCEGIYTDFEKDAKQALLALKHAANVIAFLYLFSILFAWFVRCSSNRFTDKPENSGDWLYLRAGAHEIIDENGIIPGIGKADIQRIAVVFEHSDHLHGGMIVFEIAGRIIGQVQQHFTLAVLNFFYKFLHIGNQHNFKHVKPSFPSAFISPNRLRRFLQLRRHAAGNADKRPVSPARCNYMAASCSGQHKMRRFYLQSAIFNNPDCIL